MNISVRTFTLDQLRQAQRQQLWKDWPFTPISPHRLRSYEANPFLKESEQIHLIAISIDGNPAAFQLMYAGLIQDSEQPFTWLSGKYVHPAYRGMKLSRKLLEEAYRVSGGILGGAHYAPLSGYLMESDPDWQQYQPLEYTRYYLRPPQIDANRKGSQLLSIAGKLSAPFYKQYISLSLGKPVTALPLSETLDSIPDTAFSQQPDLSKKKLQWIIDYPWLTTDPKYTDSKFPFSQYVPRFAYMLHHTQAGQPYISRLKADDMRVFPLAGTTLNREDTLGILSYAHGLGCATLDIAQPAISTRIPHKKIVNGMYVTQKLAALLNNRKFGLDVSDGLHV